MPNKDLNAHLLGLAAQIVSAHVANNRVEPSALPVLIRDTFSSLKGLLGEESSEAAPVPAVAIKKSVTPEYLICLEDGKKLKMLKRHLMAVYDLTPDQYRSRWGLPPSYPMVAPNYAEQRRSLAKKIGLGKSRNRKG